MIDISVMDSIAPILNFGLAGSMLLGGMLMIMSPFFQARTDLNRICFVSLCFWLGSIATLHWRADLPDTYDAIICMVSATVAMFLVGVKPRTDRQGLAATVFLAMVVWHFARTFSPPSDYIHSLNFLINSFLWYCLPAIVILGCVWDAGIGYRSGRGIFSNPNLGDPVER